MSENRTPSWLPSPWLLVPLFLLLGAVCWLQFTEGLGDTGMNNGISYAVGLLIGLLYVGWFAVFSGHRFGVRVGALALVGGVALAANAAIRIDGWSGSMVPDWSWSWDPASGSDLESSAQVAADDQRVDLITTTPADFPGFLGPRRDARVEGVQLARDWTQQLPTFLWTASTGAGWSGFAVVNGVAITQEQRGDYEVTVARNLLNGLELWRYAHPTTFSHFLGGDGPRATPLIDTGYVYSHGSRGFLACLDGADGGLVWSHDLKTRYGMTDELEEELVQFGRSCSPLVHGDLVIIPAGGDPAGQRVGLVAFDKRTGELRWESPARNFSHASPNVAVLAGIEQILVTNEDTITGHDPTTGSILWEHAWPGKTGGDANNSQPLPIGPDRLLISKGYGQGSSLLRLSVDEQGTLTPNVLWASKRSLRTKLTNAAVRDEYAYALSDGILECVALKDGKRVWRDGRYGHGQLLLVGDVLLVLSEEGELLMIEASPDVENVVLGQLQALEGQTWNTFALYGDTVVMRNAEQACAYRLPLANN